MKLKFYDWFVFGVLTVLAVSGSLTVTLLAVIAALLYLIVRFFVSKTAGTPPVSPVFSEFIVHDCDKDGIVDRVVVEVDVDLEYRPASGHFRLDSRFDLASGQREYEYKIGGTSVSVRLLNSCNDGESSNFEEEWEVRDGVVLESDLRTRFEAKKYKWGSLDEEIAALKKSTEWAELLSWSFNGLKYFLLKRCLPASDARRYLRQKMERLKLGNVRATQEYAAYGIEPDPSPDSIDGWRWIGDTKPENPKDTEPFWNMVKTCALGITPEETGRDGRQLILDLQKLLGE